MSAATEQEQQRRSGPAYSPVQASIKQPAMVTAFSVAEKKKIELFSRVGKLALRLSLKQTAPISSA